MMQYRMVYERAQRELTLYEDTDKASKRVFGIPDAEFVKTKMRAAVKALEKFGTVKQRGNSNVRFFLPSEQVKNQIKVIVDLLSAKEQRKMKTLNEKIKETEKRVAPTLSKRLSELAEFN